MFGQNVTRALAGVAAGVGCAAMLAGCATGGGETTATAATGDEERTLRVRQAPGGVVYWVMPGPRELSESVFGTPENPKMLAAPKIAAAEAAVEAGRMPPSVPGLLRELPILVGVPEKARSVTADGRQVLKQPNPFSDQARIVEGSFDVTYRSVVDEDPPGPPGKTPDNVDLEVSFTDPAGNDYRVEWDHVVKPPFPGYQTAGGVMIDGTHHGDTGTGSPLMPEVRTEGAFWGIGDLYVNGELREPGRVMHMMTTEVVRDRQYRLVQEADLPLPSSERHIPDQEQHTHLVVLPIRPEPGEGPKFAPLRHGFELPNGQVQPFIHVMFEQDEIVSG